MLRELLFLIATLVIIECNNLATVTKPDIPRFIGSYKYLPGVGYYKLYKYKVTWGEAWAQCRDDNAHLLIINSPEELEAVRALQIESKSDGWSHIGVHDLFINTRYITVRDEEFVPSQFNKWAPKEPNNIPAESCVSLFPNGLLRDNNCGTPLSFICEFNEHF